MMTVKLARTYVLQYANSECYQLLNRVDGLLEKAASSGLTQLEVAFNEANQNQMNAVAEFYIAQGFIVDVYNTRLKFYWGHENGPK